MTRLNLLLSAAVVGVAAAAIAAEPNKSEPNKNQPAAPSVAADPAKAVNPVQSSASQHGKSEGEDEEDSDD